MQPEPNLNDGKPLTENDILREALKHLADAVECLTDVPEVAGTSRAVLINNARASSLAARNLID